ncbi:GrpB family protein [Sinorhizobium sp. 8-89]|uniref:GrpB family protein n=1 Tax=Sinorhizobium sp. 7-81 TaxID=3049087 RepID=UPI0024C20E9C|nr:GrpB family protein [Sinorhizobium sp. 7-81]MDK1387439.1 GrpB family protein [Sinorhizobium sp. 7-81]
MPTLVEVVPYHETWANSFLEIEETIRRLLGASVVTIDHIGSTAVPGLSAKPVIDIDVTLRSLSDVPSAGSVLIAAGYESRGNRYDDDVWAFMDRISVPKQRVYLCLPANETHIRRLIFRDYLLAHKDVATAYGSLKQDLAKEFAHDGDGYTAAKTRFINEVIELACKNTNSATKLATNTRIDPEI